jgi:hypothetical protein
MAHKIPVHSSRFAAIATATGGALFLLFVLLKIEKSNPARAGGRTLATAWRDRRSL